MTQIGRRFSLSIEPGRGVFCGERGVFVGGVPLLALRSNSSGPDEWQPRPAAEINSELRKHYRAPIEFEHKMDGLGAICRALNRGDLLHARVATLHLQIPEPPVFTKAAVSPAALIDWVCQLRISGLLKQDWDPQKHPRWPAGSPDSVGGQFASADEADSNGIPAEQPDEAERAPTTTAQAGTIVAPRYAPIPFPKEIPPIPLAPDINPRRELQNPYPDRPECEEEWEHAFKYCWKLAAKGLLGTDGYRGAGSSFHKCVLGQVREDCGGNPTA